MSFAGRIDPESGSLIQEAPIRKLAIFANFAILAVDQHDQTEEEKLTLLKKLAADGFRSLDQGRGLSVASETELRSTIAKIGRRAAKVSKSLSARAGTAAQDRVRRTLRGRPGAVDRSGSR